MHCAFLAPELSATSSMVRGWIMVGFASRAHGLGEDLPDAPPLVLRQGPRLLEEYPVAHLARVGLVMDLEAFRPRDDPLVAGMAIDALDHHHAFLGLDVGHVTGLLCARAALAQDGLGPREVPLGVLHPRRVLGHAHGEL